MISTKKISLTLLEYAAPLVNDLGDNYSQSELQRTLWFVTGIWNACVLDQWKNTTEHTEAIRQQMLKANNPVMSALVEELISRKQQLFGNDPRAITNECVTVKNGDFIVRAEARLDVKDLPVDTTYAN
jgi:hypothetical protein